MATITQVNIGTTADDNTGTTLRDGGNLLNQNDAAINAELVALLTASGLASGAVDLGTFTGATISDNVDLLAALQELETEVETKTTVTVYATVAALPAPSTVLSGTIGAVVDDGVNSGLYLAIGTAGVNASSWVKA